jgi:hypothetical protein
VSYLEAAFERHRVSFQTKGFAPNPNPAVAGLILNPSFAEPPKPRGKQFSRALKRTREDSISPWAGYGEKLESQASISEEQAERLKQFEERH